MELIGNYRSYLPRRLQLFTKFEKWGFFPVKPQPSEGQDQHSPDKLYKAQRFFDKLLPEYDQEWISNQWLATNEQMIPFRGRVGIRQFIANKPSRLGIKVWAMADGSNGYILRQQIDTGKM